MPDRDDRVLAAEDVAEVLAVVAAERGIDFRDYRPEPIMRGVRQRMDASGEASVERYLQRLRDDRSEVEHLIKALVVPWSVFFRDPSVWSALRDVVVPALGRSLDGRPLRAWSIGAATGEEVWSAAMVLTEGCATPRGPAFDLLASDIDRRTLETAREGCYPAAVLGDVPEEYRRRFLVAHDAQVRVTPALRSNVRFAYHDLLGRTLAPTEAIVASFELVLARNVLIYFDRRLQQKAIERIAGTLEPGAALVLGKVETMPVALRERFVPFVGVDPDLRVFSYVGA